MTRENEPLEEQGEELFEHHRLVADPGLAPLRVDKFIIILVAHFSRNKLQQRPSQDMYVSMGNRSRATPR